MKHNKTKRHEGRDDVIGEYKWGDLGQLILLGIFIIVWISDSFIWKYSLSSFNVIPNSYRLLIALPILACSGYLAKKGLNIIFGETRAKPELVSKGVFGIVRHPIYLGSILFYLGMTIIACSIASFIVWIVIVIFYFYISKYEEKILLKELGKDYKEYKYRIPMLIPRLFKVSSIHFLFLFIISLIITVYSFIGIIPIAARTGRILFGTVWLLLSLAWFGQFLAKNKVEQENEK